MAITRKPSERFYCIIPCSAPFESKSLYAQIQTYFNTISAIDLFTSADHAAHFFDNIYHPGEAKNYTKNDYKWYKKVEKDFSQYLIVNFRLNSFILLDNVEIQLKNGLAFRYCPVKNFRFSFVEEIISASLHQDGYYGGIRYIKGHYYHFKTPHAPILSLLNRNPISKTLNPYKQKEAKELKSFFEKNSSPFLRYQYCHNLYTSLFSQEFKQTTDFITLLIALLKHFEKSIDAYKDALNHNLNRFLIPVLQDLCLEYLNWKEIKSQKRKLVR